jgi:hypothetical protein
MTPRRRTCLLRNTVNTENEKFGGSDWQAHEPVRLWNVKCDPVKHTCRAVKVPRSFESERIVTSQSFLVDAKMLLCGPGTRSVYVANSNSMSMKVVHTRLHLLYILTLADRQTLAVVFSGIPSTLPSHPVLSAPPRLLW